MLPLVYGEETERGMVLALIQLQSACSLLARLSSLSLSFLARLSLPPSLPPSLFLSLSLSLSLSHRSPAGLTELLRNNNSFAELC